MHITISIIEPNHLTHKKLAIVVENLENMFTIFKISVPFCSPAQRLCSFTPCKLQNLFRQEGLGGIGVKWRIVACPNRHQSPNHLFRENAIPG